MAITVLVTFYSRRGDTEALAHAAAVGAVQARALIRLRRLPDADPDAAVADHPAAAESMRRMHKEYVAPREADVLAVDALVIASPADLDASAPGWAAFFDLLSRLGAAGQLAGKVATVIASWPAAARFEDALARCGMTLVSSPEPVTDADSAVALGRRLVAAAHAAAHPSAQKA